MFGFVFLLSACGSSDRDSSKGAQYTKADTQIRWLTRNKKGVDAWPCFSPDGKSVVYTRGNRSFPFPKTRLFLIAVNGGQPSQLTSSTLSVNASRPDWSRRYHQIVFTAIPKFGGKKPRASIWLMNVKGPARARPIITARPGQMYFYPVWYPNSRKIAVMAVQHPIKKGRTISRLTTITQQYNLRTRRFRNLTNAKKMFAGKPSVSPNGRRIAFAGQIRSDSYDQRKNQIWIRESNGRVHQLDPYQGRAPSWSPNGKWIAFESNRSAKAANYDIYIESAKGGKPIRLTYGHFYATHPKWSPDGKMIVFNAKRIEKRIETGIAVIILPKSMRRLTGR